MTSVVLVEDEAMVRAGLRELIEAERDLEVVGEAADGRQAVDVVTQTDPDVVVMDIRLPGMGGIEVTNLLMGLARPPAVLLLTTFGLESYLLEGLRAGASGFLLKTATPEQLMDGIRVVAAGDSVVAPTMTRSLIEHAVTRTPAAPADVSSLSARELEVLELVATGEGNAEIARALSLALPTVKSHVRHILAKLGVHNRLQLILVARSAGIGGAP